MNRKTKKKKKNNRFVRFGKWISGKSVIIVTLITGITLLLLAAFLPLPEWDFFKKIQELGAKNALTLYLSQLSFTFITISVMSVLSDSSNIIYWENIVDRKLIQPKWNCFYAYTTYSFSTVIFGGIAGLFGLHFLFMALFALDVCILMALTFSMIDVYFRHGEKAEMLEKEFRELVTKPDEHYDRWEKDNSEYSRMTNGLKTNTVLALRDYDASTIYENLNFYARNASYITESDFSTIFKCVNEININDFLIFFEEYSGKEFSYYYDTEEYNSLTGMMSRSQSVFSIVFDQSVFPKFTDSMDYNMALRLFEAYRRHLTRTRDIMKETKPDYDRKKDGPATFYSRMILLDTLLDEAKRHKEFVLRAFVQAFEETNILSNYGPCEDDGAMWSLFLDSLPEDDDEAEKIFGSLSDVIEIMYGRRMPEVLEKELQYSPVRKHDVVSDQKDFFNSDDWGYGGVSFDSREYADDEEDDEEEYTDEEETSKSDEWPPESDSCSINTLRGGLNYAMSEQWGRINDGDIDPKDW